MLFRFNLLVAMILAILMFSLVGCDQPEDVITPISSSEISLDEQRLPTTPDGMVYELWVANANDTVSLGKFGYDFETKEYLLADYPSERADKNLFYLEGNVGVSNDVNDYDVIFVSAENKIDANPDSPANMMLMDYINQSTIDMIFPPSEDSLWSATVRYNMESVSGGSNASNDGSSIWFAIYSSADRSLDDTTALINWWLDSGSFVTEVIPITNVIGIDSSTLIVKDTTISLGLDTYTQRVVRFDLITEDVESNYYPTLLRLEYATSPRTVYYDEFSQDDFGLPDLSAYGFHYKGWVVSQHIDSTAVGSMTKPAWTIMGDEMSYTDGGLLTTGSFNDITVADTNNPYINTTFSNPPRIPNFPGEDFLENLPAPLVGPVNLVPYSSLAHGKVFVTVEPDNYNEGTNFPMVAFLGELPYTRGQVNAELQQYTLRGWMQNNDPFRGFPKIRVTINKF